MENTCWRAQTYFCQFLLAQLVSQFCKRNKRQSRYTAPTLRPSSDSASGPTEWNELIHLGEALAPDLASGLCEILYMRFACTSVSISFYIHKWMEKEVMGDGDGETGLIGWQKQKGHFSHEATASRDTSHKGKPQLLQHLRILLFSSRRKVWKSGPLRGNTTDFQISEGTPSVAWILWVRGTGGDDIFEPLEGND